MSSSTSAVVACRCPPEWLSLEESALVAPPTQTTVRSAIARARSTVTTTSVMRQRSSCLRSRSLVVGAFQTAARSVPAVWSQRRSWVLSGIGWEAVKRASSSWRRASSPRRCSQARSRLRATLGLIASLLHQQLALGQLGRPCGLTLGEPGQHGLQTSRRERLQEGGHDRVVHALAAQALAAVLGALQAVALVAGVAAYGAARAGVGHLELAPAAAAAQQPLQQRRALPDRPAALARRRPPVRAEPLEVGAPDRRGDEALVVVGDAHLPVARGAGPLPGGDPPAVVDAPLDLGAPVGVDAGIGRVGEDPVDGAKVAGCQLTSTWPQRRCGNGTPASRRWAATWRAEPSSANLANTSLMVAWTASSGVSTMRPVASWS